MAERQDLPIGLTGGGEKIHKIIRGLAHGTHAVRRGQRSDVREHAAGAFEHTAFPQFNMTHYNTVRPISQELFLPAKTGSGRGQ